MSDDIKRGAKGDAKGRRPMWRKAVKWAGIAAGVIVGLFLLICTAIVWILSPEKLTRIVEEQGSEFLNADVRLERAELTFWHTFPQMTVDMDGLEVVSHALEGVADSVRVNLPADADSLLSLRRFHGGVNVLALLGGKVSLSDVVFEGVRANLVQVNDSTANFLIMPADDGAEADTTALSLPDISINRFTIKDAEPLRYRSLADSLDFAVGVHLADFADGGRPVYRVTVESNMESPMLEEFSFDGLTFGADGNVVWESKRPMAVAFEDFDVRVEDYRVHVDMRADFTDVPIVESMSMTVRDLPVCDALQHVPQEFAEFMAPLKSDMRATVGVEFTDAWNMADSVLPSFRATLTVPTCEVRYDKLHLRSFAADVEMMVDGTDMNASVLDVKRLMTRGDVADFDVSARITNAMVDPRIEGTFSGRVDFGNLPKALLAKFGGSVTGLLTGKMQYALNMSDLTPENFHRLNVRGQMELKNFDASADSVGRVYTRLAELDFGSNSRFVADDRHTIDSLLTVSMKVDTLWASADGMRVSMRGLRAGAATMNRSSSADTTEINPFGMKVEVERLNFISPADTLRMRLRNATASGSLRRFRGDAHLPQIGLKVAVERLMAGQSLNRVSLNKADLALDLHMRRQHNGRVNREHGDSTRRHRTGADTGSGRGHTAKGEETMSFDMDSTNRALLRNWDFSGKLTARGGRLATPSFPLRNSLRNINLRFNQDSVTLENLRYKAGQSDFLVNGSITNLRNALLGRRRDNTLGVQLSLRSDTLNVNEIVKALFAGSAVSQSADSAMIWSEKDDIDTHLDQMADTATTGPLLIPHNIDARFSMRASNVLYSDMVLHNLRGSLMVYDGAINLRNLSASTEMGSIALDGLYEGARADSLQFGMGMRVNRLRLDRLTSIVPAIDSLMPMMQNFAGIVNADIAVTTDLTPQMDIEIPTLCAAIKLDGDSLVLLDPDTFKMVSKWLLFRDKSHNMIDHMEVEVVIDNSMVELYPFMFDIDRYRLGVMGSNDLAMNMNYHISVLKSPVPFKFGINIKGTPDKMKIRLGGAKVKENMVVERQAIATNTRINIVDQINNVFRRGVTNARRGRLSFDEAAGARNADMRNALNASEAEEQMSYQDSLQFIRQGLIENPDTLRFPPASLQ